jgi:hypothetical protein
MAAAMRARLAAIAGLAQSVRTAHKVRVFYVALHHVGFLD